MKIFNKITGCFFLALLCNRLHAQQPSVTDQFSDIEIPLNKLVADSSILLPRSYPGFQPMWFKGSSGAAVFSLSGIEKIEVTIGWEHLTDPYELEVASIWLQKSK